MTSNQGSATGGIEQAIELSEQILLAVEAADLQRVASLYQDRQAIIDDEYARSAVSATHTRTLLELNQRIERSLSELQRQTQLAQARASKSAQATRAYQSVAGNRGQS